MRGAGGVLDRGDHAPRAEGWLWGPEEPPPWSNGSKSQILYSFVGLASVSPDLSVTSFSLISNN